MISRLALKCRETCYSFYWVEACWRVGNDMVALSETCHWHVANVLFKLRSNKRRGGCRFRPANAPRDLTKLTRDTLSKAPFTSPYNAVAFSGSLNRRRARAIACLERLRAGTTTTTETITDGQMHVVKARDRRGRKSMGAGERKAVSARMKRYWASRREQRKVK
jgi:hypothetical protein